MKVKDEVFDWIKLRVQNGKSCRFWSDNWSPFGSLQNFLQSSRRSRLGIRMESTLSDLCNHDQWLLPPARSENQFTLQVFLTTIQLTQEEDYYEWEIDGTTRTKYSTGEVYNKLKGPGVDVPWGNIVWNKGGIPKHNFLTWLFVLNRCPTRDRILGWGLPTASDCLLCNTMPESQDHLFFDCSHSWSVWSVVASRCGLIPERLWVRSLVQLQMLSGRKKKKRLTVLALQCTIYALWTERNARLHCNTFRSFNSLLAQIDLTIRNCIASYREVNQPLASSMLQLWLLTAS